MIITRLKEATCEQYADVECVADVMNKMFNIEDHKTLQTKFYRSYSTVVPLVAINNMRSAGQDLDERKKTKLLEADLAVGYNETVH